MKTIHSDVVGEEVSDESGAINSIAFKVSHAGSAPASFIAGSLDATTSYTIQVLTATGWEDLYLDNQATPITLTNQNKVVAIYSPGVYRGVKVGATVSKLSVATAANLVS